jgi:hypothetical protein
MTDITFTDIQKSGVLKKLARQGKEFVIKLRGEPDLLVIPQTSEKKRKQLIKCSETLVIPDEYKTSEFDFSKYDFDTPYPVRPVADGETYASLSPSLEHLLTADFDQN